MESTKHGPDYYAILGVPQDAPPELIKARYRFLLFATHPDTSATTMHTAPVQPPAGKSAHAGKQTKQAQQPAEKLALYREAYAVLGDPERRRRYNLDHQIRLRPRALHPGYPLYQRILIAREVARVGGSSTFQFVRHDPCPTCWLVGCARCEGQGMIPEQVIVNVSIPPNTAKNDLLLVEFQGGQREPGGSRGHLFVYADLS